MGNARLRIVELDGGLIKLEVAIAGVRLCAFAKACIST